MSPTFVTVDPRTTTFITIFRFTSIASSGTTTFCVGQMPVTPKALVLGSASAHDQKNAEPRFMKERGL